MPYSLDLRKKVIDYLEHGGNITKAASIFAISRASIYRWLKRKDLKAIVVKHRQRKLNWQDLKLDVMRNPDLKLIDRARKFDVRPSAISYAFKKMKITRKKNNYVIRKEKQKKE